MTDLYNAAELAVVRTLQRADQAGKLDRDGKVNAINIHPKIHRSEEGDILYESEAETPAIGVSVTGADEDELIQTGSAIEPLHIVLDIVTSGYDEKALDSDVRYLMWAVCHFLRGIIWRTQTDDSDGITSLAQIITLGDKLISPLYPCSWGIVAEAAVAIKAQAVIRRTSTL